MSTSLPEDTVEAPTDTSPEISHDDRRAIRKKAVSISVALIPVGLAFGIACGEAGLQLWQAVGFSTLVFTGGSQFAAIGVLSNGGSPLSAIASALLLGLRCLAYGVVMTPHLRGPAWKRAIDSHLMIDESVAVGLSAADPANVRYGYRWGGGSVFVLWNASTVLGAVIGSSAGDLIHTLGIDAAVPASFLALLWPRLEHESQRRNAILGAIIAAALIPLAPAGIPILASALAAFVGIAGLGRAPKPREGQR